MRKELVLVVLLVLLSGCLERRELIAPEREVLANWTSGDADGDGAPDWFSFFFEPYNITPQMSLARRVLVAGVIEPRREEFNFTESFSLEPARLAETRRLLAAFNASRFSPTPNGPAEAACRRAGGVEQPCADLAACRAACSASGECAAKLALYGDVLAQALLDFSQASHGLDRALATLSADLDAAQASPSLARLNRVAGGFESAKAFAAGISTTSLATAFGLCAPVPVGLNLLEDARRAFIASVQTTGALPPPPTPRPPERFTVLVRLTLSMSEGSAFSDLSLTEVIPREFAADASQIEFGVNYTDISARPPFVVTWRHSNVGGRAGESEIAYLIKNAGEPREGWLEWARSQASRPQLSLTRLEPMASPAVVFAKGVYSGVLSFFISVSNFHVAVGVVAALALVALWLLWSGASFILALVNAVRTRKDLKEAVYAFAGHGSTQTLAYLAIGVGLTLLGLAVIHLTAPFPQPLTAESDVLQALSADFAKTAGSLSIFFGLMSLYFLIADFSKGIVLGKRYYERPLPTGVRAVMYEAQILEAAKGMRDSIELLLERAREPRKQGFVFEAEEKAARSALAILDACEAACKAANLAQANIELQRARGAVEKAKAALEAKLAAQERLSSLAEKVQKADKAARSALEAAAKIGVDIREEEKALGASPASTALEEARSAWSADDLAKAERILGEKLAELEALSEAAAKKGEERKLLLGRTFRCPECSRSISVVSAVCPYCKSDVAAKIREKAEELRKAIDRDRKELEPARAFLETAAEEKTLSEIEAALPDILDAAGRRAFDEATKSLEAEASRYDKVKPLLRDKLEAFKGLTERRGILEKRVDVIRHMLAQGAKLGLDLSAEEKEFGSLDLEGAVARVRELFKAGKFAAADELLTATENSFERLEAHTGDVIEDFRNQSDRLALAAASLSRIEESVAKAKKAGLSVWREEAEAKSINLERLRAALKAREPVAKDIDAAVERVAAIEKNTARKLEAFEALEAKLASLEKEMKEGDVLLNKCLVEGIDVGVEHESLYAIDLDRLRASLSVLESVEGVRAQIEGALSAADGALASLREKLAMLENWSAWSAHIASLLRRQDTITESMLVAVPEKWRKWAMEKYLTEHPAESFVIENNALVRLKPAPVSKFQFEVILQRLVASQKIDAAAVVRRDGLMIASTLPPAINSETIAAMAARIASKSEMVSGELRRGLVKDVIIATKEGRLVLLAAGRMAILITLIKPQEDIGFVLITMGEAAKEIAALLEGRT
ncbi:MAG: roadblock/LC7 domain-containing protein [Candidatus Micrarchaeia archaeon]